MPDRPIIFSAPMVRALLDGRKTQTRRLLRGWPGPTYTYAAYNFVLGWSAYSGDPLTGPRSGLDVPYAPGDRLYVREAFAKVGDIDDDIHACPDLRIHAYYRADAVDPERQRWRSPIQMPRWASRITLTVTKVRVQRLQEISAEDVQAEGACELAFVPPSEADTEEARRIFHDLWNSLHGPDAWDANPWVVAVSFTVRKGNIDQETTP